MIARLMAAFIAAVVVLAAADRPAAHPDYTVLDREGQPFRDAFNRAADKVRVVAYVAPTCGGCLRGADQLEARVLGEIDDPNVAVYVVWVPKNGARERHVGRVTRLVTDKRAAHYWDERGVVVRTLDALLGIRGRACAGAFLVYPPGAMWTDDAPPDPHYWSDAHAREFEDHGPEFDAARLRDAVRAQLQRLSSDDG